MEKTAFADINSYIAVFSPLVQEKLHELKTIISKSVPAAEETISYNMPAFKYKGALVYFAAYKNHIGFYPTASPIVKFEKELRNFKTSKGAIQFPLDRPLPGQLIQKILHFKAKENEEKERVKKVSRKKTAL
jgi:uncharacterized protein YdhG (YjbR/CyaY superfamily)